MAIDTRFRRAAALDHEEMWAEAVPYPQDAGIAPTERRHLLWSYFWDPTKGNATLTDAVAHAGAITDALAHAGAVTDALAHAGAVADA
jgi:hypothetical protein